MLHQKWIWGIHCNQARKHASNRSTLALKSREDVTRIQNRPHQKGLSNVFWNKKSQKLNKGSRLRIRDFARKKNFPLFPCNLLTCSVVVLNIDVIFESQTTIGQTWRDVALQNYDHIHSHRTTGPLCTWRFLSLCVPNQQTYIYTLSLLAKAKYVQLLLISEITFGLIFSYWEKNKEELLETLYFAGW